MKKGLTLSFAFLAGMIAPGLAYAGDAAVSLDEAIKTSKVLADFRLRYEGAEFDNFDGMASALTYRARIGFETGTFANTKFLVEFDHVQDIVGDFNSTTNGNVAYPVIADPNVTELNRLQLTNTSLPDTTVTLGRQRIILDDARFVGNVGWRQNEQTYDAVRVVNKSVEGLTLDASYIDQVNRIFGDESSAGRFKSDSWLLNAGYDLPFEGATIKIAGYAYLLDLSASALSSQTYGARASLKKGVFGFKAGYAAQSDYGNQPVDYSEDYYVLEASAAKDGFSGAIGIEVMSGDGTKAFTTPLATLHKFNGFADVFLGTPANGLEDLYIKAGYKTKPVGPLPFINMFAVYHNFKSENVSSNLGSEIDAVIATKLSKKTGLLVKYASYDADSYATNRERYSIQLDYKF